MAESIGGSSGFDRANRRDGDFETTMGGDGILDSGFGSNSSRRLRSGNAASRNHGGKITKQFLRLKLTLLKNSFRRSIWYSIAFILGILSALGTIVFAIIGAVAGGILNPLATGQWLIILGAVTILGWIIIPLVAFGIDTSVDPQRFTLFPISIRQLMLGTGVAGAVGIPGVATALTLLGVVFAWVHAPWVIPVALIGAIGAFLLCIIGSRALATWLAPKLEGRRSREVMSILLVIPLMLFSPIITVLTSLLTETEGAAENAATFFQNVTNVLGWTPFGAPWGMALAAYNGNWLGVITRLLILAAAIYLLWLLWEHSLRLALESPRQQTAKATATKGLGFFNRAHTPVGAVAARTATYWLRDPRYSMSLLVTPLLPVLLIVPMLFSPSDEPFTRYTILIMGPLVAWMYGFSISNDIGYDYTAFALHITSGISGRIDRLGRLIPVLIIGVPLSIAFTILSVGFSGHWNWLPPMLGLSLGTLLGTLGVSAAASGKFVYPVAKPGESPFKQPQGAMAATMVSQFATMGISGLVMLPLLGLAAWALLGHQAVVGWVLLVVGPALGALALFIGIRIGAKALDRNAPELLQKVHAFV